MGHERGLKKHWPVFAPLKQTLQVDVVDQLMDVYSKYRTENEHQQSDGTVLVLMSGPLPKSPTNKHVIVSHSTLLEHVPKRQPPHICSIDSRVADALARTRAKTAVASALHANMVFA